MPDVPERCHEHEWGIDLESIAEAVHHAWWDQARAQGRHAPAECPHRDPVSDERRRWCDTCHPDMIPYAELDEATREYDRATARAVLEAIRPYIDRLERERDAARAEAERYRQQYEALRAGVERGVQDLHERARATARDWKQSGHPYHDGASDAYYEAGMMVRRVLSEAGGGEDA